jgi:DNA sulfur modification protein DndB
MDNTTKIPAIRGKIGNTVYYTTNLTFGQVAKLVKRVDSELHTSNSLKEEIQRSLSNNYIQIKDYILNRDDHFFDSLVLAVYDGDPKWTEVRYEINDDTFYNIGLLELSGQEKIFPVDGQHRVEGIKAALQQQSEICGETISVILIGHSNTPDGRERSRRIFSTLNRYVKPVRLGDIIALDEDDIVAIVTRELLETYPLFVGNKIKASNSKSIPTSDKSAFTSLMTLYDCHLSLLNVFLDNLNNRNYTTKQLKDYLKYRPDENVIMDFTNYLIDFWDLMRNNFIEIDRYVNVNEENAAEDMRSQLTGGNIFFRPIGLLPFVESVSKIKLSDSNLSYNDILQRFSRMNRIVSQEPWRMILWNPLTNRMIMRNQSLVKYLLINMFDANLLSQREIHEMKSKFATIFNISEQEAEQRINSNNV